MRRIRFVYERIVYVSWIRLPDVSVRQRTTAPKCHPSFYLTKVIVTSISILSLGEQFTNSADLVPKYSCRPTVTVVL